MRDTSRHRNLEFQDRAGVLWSIEMIPNQRIPCSGCGKATEVRCLSKAGHHQMFIDEAADPQVSVNAVLDLLNGDSVEGWLFRGGA